MIDVKKLNNTIDELENNAVALARVGELYNRLEKFKAELDVLHNVISDNENLLKKTEADMRASIEILRSQLDNMPVELKALRTEIEKGIGAIHQGINNRFEVFTEKLQAFRTEIDRVNASMHQEIDNRLEVYAADQKLAMGTLLNDMQSLQNKHRSDIEVAIRNEGAQVQRGLENIVKEKHLALQTILEKRFTDMEANNTRQNRYLFVGFALMGINIILVLAALWFLRQ